MSQLPANLFASTDDLFASQLQDNLVASATAVLLTHTSPTRRVRIDPAPYVPPPSPTPDKPSPPSIPGPYPIIFQQSIDKALSKAYNKNTLKNYTSGINAFLAFCARYNIPPEASFPASDQLLCAFIALQPESMSPSTINNYLSGIRSWHVRNGFPFQPSDRLKLLKKAPRPLANVNPARKAVTVRMIEYLASDLDLNSHSDAAIFACAATAFWGLARLGELIPTSSSLGNPIPFPLASNLDQGVLESIKLRLPWTKTKKWAGEILHITSQAEPANPISALKNHCLLNEICGEALLFSFLLHGSRVPLTKKMVMSRCNDVWQHHNITHTTGHSFRIGGTTHLLLCGIPSDTVKKAGRWSSDSFLRYWSNLDTLLPQQISNAVIQPTAGQLGEPREGSAVARRSDLG